jgi:hypothetical protein
MQLSRKYTLLSTAPSNLPPHPQSTNGGRVEIEGVYLPSAGAYTTTLSVMVDIVKGGERAPPNLTRLGCFFHHVGMYARKWPLPLCVHSVSPPPASPFPCTLHPPQTTSLSLTALQGGGKPLFSMAYHQCCQHKVRISGWIAKKRKLSGLNKSNDI